MTNAMHAVRSDGYKMPTPGLIASMMRDDSSRRYLYTVRDDDTSNGAAVETDEDTGTADMADAHDKAEDAPVFPLEACGDLQWFPEFKSLFGTD
jgi:hypothetical protein